MAYNFLGTLCGVSLVLIVDKRHWVKKLSENKKIVMKKLRENKNWEGKKKNWGKKMLSNIGENILRNPS